MEYSVYVLTASHYTYYKCKEVTVIAKSPKEALKICDDLFEQFQKPINVERICGCDATEPKMLTRLFC